MSEKDNQIKRVLGNKVIVDLNRMRGYRAMPPRNARVKAIQRCARGTKTESRKECFDSPPKIKEGRERCLYWHEERQECILVAGDGLECLYPDCDDYVEMKANESRISSPEQIRSPQRETTTNKEYHNMLIEKWLQDGVITEKEAQAIRDGLDGKRQIKSTPVEAEKPIDHTSVRLKKMKEKMGLKRPDEKEREKEKSLKERYDYLDDYDIKEVKRLMKLPRKKWNDVLLDFAYRFNLNMNTEVDRESMAVFMIQHRKDEIEKSAKAGVINLNNLTYKELVSLAHRLEKQLSRAYPNFKINKNSRRYELIDQIRDAMREFHSRIDIDLVPLCPNCAERLIEDGNELMLTESEQIRCMECSFECEGCGGIFSIEQRRGDNLCRECDRRKTLERRGRPKSWSYKHTSKEGHIRKRFSSDKIQRNAIGEPVEVDDITGKKKMALEKMRDSKSKKASPLDEILEEAFKEEDGEGFTLLKSATIYPVERMWLEFYEYKDIQKIARALEKHLEEKLGESCTINKKANKDNLISQIESVAKAFGVKNIEIED